MMEAQCELKAAGKPYPRTCPVCKLGPCTRMKTVPVGNPDQDIKAVAQSMLDYRAREIARCIDAGETGAAQEWRTMFVPDFLKRFMNRAEND